MKTNYSEDTKARENGLFAGGCRFSQKQSVHAFLYIVYIFIVIRYMLCIFKK